MNYSFNRWVIGPAYSLQVGNLLGATLGLSSSRDPKEVVASSCLFMKENRNNNYYPIVHIIVGVSDLVLFTSP